MSRMNEEERYGIVAKLLVEGDIQGTGYRVLVMRNARRMGVVGIVKNLVDRRVEIFCQCKDRPHMDEFIKKINVQKPRDIFLTGQFSLLFQKLREYLYRPLSASYTKPLKLFFQFLEIFPLRFSNNAPTR